LADKGLQAENQETRKVIITSLSLAQKTRKPWYIILDLDYLQKSEKRDSQERKHHLIMER